MECIFCKIAEGSIKADIVYQDESVLAFKDINPEAPVHILIIPRKHIESVVDLNEKDIDVIGHIFMVAKKLSAEFKISESGFRIVNNCGKDGLQSVNHIHFHLIGGRTMQWPPG
jgi:histidine triad (HIT) family protein